MITEQIELLGKGLYTNIPDVLTLKQLPTSSELDYVGSEDFDKVMLDKILPQAVEEKINFNELLEIDYQWLLRCLRILNYGPYYTTNTIFCPDCGKVSRGEYQVNLETIECKPLPEGFNNDIVVHRDEFLDYDGDIHLKLPTVQKILNSYKDKAFQLSEGRTNRDLARICYSISAMGTSTNLTPMEYKFEIMKKLSPADFLVLKERVAALTDYGLRAGGSTQCPSCKSMNATFIALVDDRFFRPTLGDLREWKHSRSSRRTENLSASPSTTL